MWIGIISIVDADPDPDPERNQINVDPPLEPTKFHTCWKPVLRIRIPHLFKYRTDLEPAFYLIADPDRDPGC